MADYRDVNRANWDERVPAHVASPSYHVEQFLADPSYLSEVVRFDRPRLGDVSGLRGVHLQCHIGTDTVSLARLGARMTGLDFSRPAVDQARSMAERLGLAMDFHVADVYDAVGVLGAAAYDFVYTGIGALCWLPDIQRWAQVVAGLLKPGGRLFIREGHPMLWAIDEEVPGTDLVVNYPYFERAEPTAEGLLALVVEALIREHEDGVLLKGLPDAVERGVVHGTRQIDAVDAGAETRMNPGDAQRCRHRAPPFSD